MEESNSKKRPLQLDCHWNQILDDQNDTEPPPLLIIKPPPPPPPPTSSPREDCTHLSDRELAEQIVRQKQHLSSLTLPDGGQKIRSWLQVLEVEQQRRRSCRLQSPPPETDDVEICEKPTTATKLRRSGKIDGVTRENSSSLRNSRSEFTSLFSRKLEENTDCSVVKAFDKELSIMGRCNRPKTISNGTILERERQKGRSSSRQSPFRCASSVSHNRDKRESNSDIEDRASTNPFSQNGGGASINFSKKNVDCQVLPSNGSRSRKDRTVVLLDEDETQLVEMMVQEDKLAECMKDAKIYYPSRDDPESVEICYTEIDSLAPKSFLTSPIMTFYIRYLQLQTSPTNKAITDTLFFNTFFYNKLKQAVSYKWSEKESLFIKFRRWWKGVNIFQKAYVLIPINEDLHWSLVIICIPDKEDESGPIILHLDSLGLHSSKNVFDDIKSYLIQEWNYLKNECASLDIPISERIWNHLPRRIEQRKLEVPQQKNDYDCGVFVLFFMERFIEEAPERLKKKDLAMFGKRWFRPEEASSLRAKIRKLLLDEFKNAKDTGCVSESSHSSLGVVSP